MAGCDMARRSPEERNKRLLFYIFIRTKTKSRSIKRHQEKANVQPDHDWDELGHYMAKFFFLPNKSGNQSERTIRFINVWDHFLASLNNSHFRNRAVCKTELFHVNHFLLYQWLRFALRLETLFKTEAWGNCLTPKSDQQLVSPYNIIVYKNKRRLKAYENKEIDHKLNTQTS